MHKPSLLFLLFILFFVACTVTEFEPVAPVQDVVTAVPTRTSSTPTRTTPTPLPPTVTPTFNPTVLTTTPWPPDPLPSPTPVPIFPDMTYTTEEGLWRINAQWQPELLTTQTNILDVNGRNFLFTQDNDIWLGDLDTGAQTNLANTPAESECCVSFWDGNPTKITYLLIDGASGFARLHDFVSGETIPLAPGHTFSEMAGSPNGRFLAYDLNGTDLWIYDTEMETAVKFNLDDYTLPPDTQITRLGAPSWSPDSQRLALIVAINTPQTDTQIALVIFDQLDNSATIYHPYHNIGRGGWFPPAQWSPDGQWIAFIAEDIDPTKRGIWVINTNNGEEKLIANTINPIWSPDGQWLYYQTVNTNNLTHTLTYPPDFTYQIGTRLPANAHLLTWQNPK